MFTRPSSTLLLALSLCLSAPGCNSGPPKPGQAEFDRADEALKRFESKTGFGADEALATAFAAKAKAIDGELFSGGASRLDDATTQGQWMAHVQRKGSTTVFMVRVPLLKTYKGANRDVLMTDVLWEAAREVAPDDVASGDVVIAARGALAYGGIARGSLASAPEIETGALVDSTQLYAYFDGA